MRDKAFITSDDRIARWRERTIEKNSTPLELRGERADGRIDPSTLGARSPTAGFNVIQYGPTNNTITMTSIRDRPLINV